jgi:hypothetical protein
MVASFRAPTHIGTLKRSTANFGLGVPYFDTPGWGDHLENDLDIIDAVLHASSLFLSVSGVWENSHTYAVGARVIDSENGFVYQALAGHTSSGTGVFSTERAAHPTYWLITNASWNFRGAWVTATAYVIGDVVYVTSENVVAVCSVAHTSTTDIRTDAAKWNFIVDMKSSVTAAAASATAAEAAATASAGSATASAASAVTAASHAADALTYSTNSAVSAAAALVSETNAQSSEDDAETAATASATSASAASTSASGSAASLASMNSKWGGAQSADPTTDLNGDPLTNGFLYYNSTLAVFRAYDGNTAAFVNAPALTWAALTGKPTTLAGFGITDAQPLDSDLTTWAGLTPSANAQSLVTAANYAAMRTLLSLVVGTNVQAWDADLDSLAALATTTHGRALLTKTAAEDVRLSEVVPTFVATRTALKAIDTTKDTVAFLTEVGREGMFLWRAGNYSSQITADTAEGIYVKATAIASASGSWVRQYSIDHVRLDWFGAVLDGSTSDAAALTCALAVSAANYCLKVIGIPKSVSGCSLGSTTFTIAEGQRVIGVGGHTQLKSTANPLFNISSFSVNGASIKPAGASNLFINMTGSAAGVNAFLLKTGSGVVYNCLFENLTFWSCAAFADETHATNYLTDITCSRIRILLPTGPSFLSHRSRGTIRLFDWHIDNNDPSQTLPVTWIGIDIRDTIGVELEHVDTSGPTATASTYQSTAICYSFTSAVAGGNSTISMRNCFADSSTGNGCLIDGIQNIIISESYFYHNLGYQLQLSGCTSVKCSDLNLKGGVGLTGAPASINGFIMNVGAHGAGTMHDIQLSDINVDSCTGSGFSIVGASDLKMVNVSSQDNTTHGVVLSSVTDLQATNVTVKNNGGWGWIEASASDRCVKMNIRSNGNTSGSISQVGAASSSIAYTPNSGTFTGGPTTGTTNIT